MIKNKHFIYRFVEHSRVIHATKVLFNTVTVLLV